MTGRDLHDVLNEFAREEASAAEASAPDPALEARMLGARIARQRALRAGSTSVAAAAVVVGLAVGVQALSAPDPAPPAAPTPRESVAPTPTSEPSPSATRAPAVTHDPAPVTVAPGLLDALPLPDDLLASTTPEWSVVTYLVPGETRSTVLYLVDPNGLVYEIPTPLDLSVRDGDLEDVVEEWEPGSSMVVLHHALETGVEVQVRDVLTGEVHSSYPADPVRPDVRFIGDGTGDVLVTRFDLREDDYPAVRSVERFTAGGQLVASMPGDGVSWAIGTIDAEGHRMLVEGSDGAIQVIGLNGLARAATYEAPEHGSIRLRESCLRAWFVGDEVMLACRGAGDRAPDVDVWVTGPEGARLVASGVPGYPESAFPTSSGVVVTDAAGAATSVHLDGSVQPAGALPGLEVSRAVGDGILVLHDSTAPSVLGRYDAASGGVLPLLTAEGGGLLRLASALEAYSWGA